MRIVFVALARRLGTFIKKELTLTFFMCLPASVSKVFMSMSLLSIIFQIRQIDFTRDNVVTEVLETLLHMTVSDMHLAFPKDAAAEWIWTQSVLNRKIYLDNQKYTLAQAIADDTIFRKYSTNIIEALLYSMPLRLRYKAAAGDIANLFPQICGIAVASAYTR